MGLSLDKHSSNEKIDNFSFYNLNSRFNNFSFFERENYSFLNEDCINNTLEEQSIEINDRSLDIKYEDVNNQKDNPIVQNIIDNIQTTKTEKNVNINNNANINETSELNHSNNRNNQNNTFIGNKREFTESNEEENFVLDKYIKKIRSIILNTLLIFFNSLIKVAYNNDIGQGFCKKQLLPIDKKCLNHSYVESDKEFLDKKLIDIFSVISEKYTSYPKTHNKELIEKMINFQYYGNYFKELFELSFLDCLEHIRGTKNSEILDGLPKMEQILKNEGKNLKNFDLNNIREIINHYEVRVEDRKSRAKKSKKK